MKNKKQIEKVKNTKKTVTVKEKKNTKKIKNNNTLFCKLSKIIRDNLYDVILAVFSVIALIIGSIAIGFKRAIIIVVLLDIIFWFLPIISFIGNKTKRKFKRKTLVQVFLWCIVGGLGLCIIFALYIVIKAPQFNPNNLYSKESTVIYDKDGLVAAKIGSQMREKVSYEELPDVLVDAVVATEDSQFFEHNGFNPLRFAKASVTQILTGGGGGASTITMQVSKNAFTSFDASGLAGIIRKFTDIYLSIFKIEKAYTKEEILEFYVNSYYMGGDAWGVEQACQTYFGKHVSEINTSEAALIAGLFKGGYAYDPYLFPKQAENRRQVVLSLMKRHGYITEEEEEIASKLTVNDIVITERNEESYQAFIDTVVAEVKEKTGKNPYTVPMEIYSTMDASKQEYVNKVMSGEKFKWENDTVQAGVAVTDTNTGAIVAIGAGRNRIGANTFNYATMINRQIGSTAKPLYDYGPAIQYNNMSTAEPITDEPYSYSDGTGLKNWDGGFKGYMTARTALKASRNIPALKVFQKVKNSNIKAFVTGLGLNPDIQANGQLYEAHSIGGYNGESPLSMAAAYATFANGGTYIEPYSFTKIVYKETNEEYTNKYETRKAMDDSTAYMITSMLIDTAVYTTGYSQVNGIRYADKTGTTNFDWSTIQAYNLPYGAINDLWCVGYSRDYAIGVWYGYDQVSSKSYSYSNGQNTNLFRKIATGVLTGTKEFTAPSSVTAVEVEKDTSEVKLASAYTPKEYKTTEYFKNGTEPTEVSNRFAELPNVKGLNIKKNDSTISLNWNYVDSIKEFDKDALTEEFSKIFNDETQLKGFVEERLDKNHTILGEIEYEVYLKNSDNSLQLIGKTTNNYYEYRPVNLTNGTLNFVVKTTYSIFKDNSSSGSEAGISVNDISALITSNINGASQMILGIGDIYVEPTKPVIVLDGMIDVTNEANISKVIKNTNGNIVSSIQTNASNVYTITYQVNYKNHNNVLEKTITVR